MSAGFGRGRATWFVLGLLVVGCGGDTDPPPRVEVYRPIERVDRVDLLFMIDNSNGTTQEQTELAGQLPRLIEVLSSGDLDPDDGITRDRDFTSVRSLHVGVITSDMGAGGYDVSTCDAREGDDGVLRTTGNGAITGCDATYPPFLSFDPFTDDTAAFAAEASCLLVAGTDGCGFEQPLEAILKAVTPSSQDAVGAFDGRFAMGTTGHADGANAGFLRPDSLLAIVAETDEDDCSARDPELYDEASSIYEGDLNLRCFEHPDALYPIARYVDGLLATRSSPELLVFAPLAGVPTSAASPPDAIPDYEAILAHPDMQVMLDPDMPTRLRPSCNEAGEGFAFPPRRIIEVAQALSERGVSTAAPSVCETDLTNAMDAIIQAIAARFVGCFTRDLGVDPEGRVPCELMETLPAGDATSTCDELPGRTRVGVDETTGTEVCRVEQLATDGTIPTGDGWYYDTFSPLTLRGCADTGTRPARIAYTDSGVPTPGAAWHLECTTSSPEP